VPGQRRPAAAGEQREPVIEAFGELRRGQRARPDRGQLDGQRHAVERPADPRHRVGVGLINGEAGHDGGRAVTEQTHRRRRRDIRDVRVTDGTRGGGREPAGGGTGGVGGGWRPRGCRGRDGKGNDRPEGLAVDPERLSARRQDPDARAVGEEPAGQDSGRLNDVLAVVQDQHRVPAGQRAAQPVHRVGQAGVGAVPREPPLAQAERVEHRVGHLGRLADRGEPGEPRRRGQPRRGLGRQPGLAHPARAGQRDEPLGGQLLQHAGDVVVPADEAGRRTLASGEARGWGLGRRHRPFWIMGESSGGGGGLERDLLPQDREVHLRQARGRVHPEPVREQVPAVGVDGQRVRLAADGGEGAHQEGARALGQRVRGGQLAQLADQAARLAEREVGLDPVELRGGPQLLEPGGGRLAQQGHGPGRVARPQGAAARAGGPLELRGAPFTARTYPPANTGRFPCRIEPGESMMYPRGRRARWLAGAVVSAAAAGSAFAFIPAASGTQTGIQSAIASDSSQTSAVETAFTTAIRADRQPQAPSASAYGTMANAAVSAGHVAPMTMAGQLYGGRFRSRRGPVRFAPRLAVAVRQGYAAVPAAGTCGPG